jgi:uncharacterized protein
MESQPIMGAFPVPNEDERTMTFLAHLLQVFTGFVGPLVIFCVKQNSKFVKFHALQSLIWQLCFMAVWFCLMIGFVISVFATMPHVQTGAQQNGPPPAFLYFFPLLWLAMMGGWVANMILGIVYGIKANRGEWAAYPVIGRLVWPKELGRL